MSDVLRVVGLKHLNINICKQAHDAALGLKLDERMLCAGALSGGVDTCRVG